MIGSLTGKVQMLTAPHILMDVAGIGYEVEMPLSTYCQLKNDQLIRIWTHLTVREDAQLLYGFIDVNDKNLFRVLLKVNGVGPKLALGILSSMSAAMLVQSIEMQDVTTLTRIPGVGKKTAERLVIELRDRLQAFSGSENSGAGQPQMVLNAASPISEAEAALVSLGYKPIEAQRAVASIKHEHSDTADLIRAALKGMLKK